MRKVAALRSGTLCDQTEIEHRPCGAKLSLASTKAQVWAVHTTPHVFGGHEAHASQFLTKLERTDKTLNHGVVTCSSVNNTGEEAEIL